MTTLRKFEQHSVHVDFSWCVLFVGDDATEIRAAFRSVGNSFVCVCVWVASGCRVFVVGVKVALSCREQLGWIESRRGNG